MASIDTTEYIGFMDEMLSSFPSSPDQIVSVSPRLDDSEIEFGVYNYQTYAPKMNHVSADRMKRRETLAAVPISNREIISPLSSPRGNNNYSQQPTYAVPISYAPVDYESMNYAVQSRNNCIQQSAIAPTSLFTTNSRIKSTVPNLDLLFSLFDVLYDEEDSTSCSSHSSPSLHSSPPACVPEPEVETLHYPQTIPSHSSSTSFIKFNSSSYENNSWIDNYYPDRTSFLGNFVENY